MGIGTVESAAVVEAEGGVIREGVVIADGKLSTTGILAKSADSTSLLVANNSAGCRIDAKCNAGS